MTCKEKLAMEHPEYISTSYAGGCFGCPHQYEYLDRPELCNMSLILSTDLCTKCWDRDIPEENANKVKKKEYIMLYETKNVVVKAFRVGYDHIPDWFLYLTEFGEKIEITYERDSVCIHSDKLTATTGNYILMVVKEDNSFNLAVFDSETFNCFFTPVEEE